MYVYHLTGFVYNRQLLTMGLHGLEGVVYLDNQDRKMIVTRAGGMRPLLLADCHVPPDLRFTFYDQVHTTGESLLTWFFTALLVERGVLKLSPCGRRYSWLYFELYGRVSIDARYLTVRNGHQAGTVCCSSGDPRQGHDV